MRHEGTAARGNSSFAGEIFNAWRSFFSIHSRAAVALVAVAIGVGLWAVPALAHKSKNHHRARTAATTSGNDSCGYPNSTFTENTVMRGAEVIGSGLNAQIAAFANDEKGLLLGVNGATANTSAPQHVSNPSLGNSYGPGAPKDSSGRYYFPALYITDVTNGGNGAGASGDFQSGGTPWNINSSAQPFINDVFGTWSTATVSGGSYTVHVPAGKNDWNLGPGSDTPIDTSFDEGYGAEIRWNVSDLSNGGTQLAPGNTYRIQVIEHDGDQNKTGGDAGEFCVTLTIPALTTSATSTTIGGSITDTATLAGTNHASGTITWKVYSDSKCTTLADTLTASATGDGSYTSPPFTPANAGSYYWVASFSGSGVSLGSSCGDNGETSTVSPSSPGLTTSASNATVGSAIHDTATLTGGVNPTGTITWNVYKASDTSCSSPLNAAGSLTATVTKNGSYTSPDYTPADAGKYFWTATYSGDGNNVAIGPVGCNTTAETSTVSPQTPTVTTVASSGTIGGTITDVATVSGGDNPTGTLTWAVYAFTDTSCSTALFTTGAIQVTGDGQYTSPPVTPTAPGNYQWVATYTPASTDVNNTKVVTPCNAANEESTVNKITPQLVTIASDGVGGTPVTDIAQLTGGDNPTGTITWTVYSNSTCSGSPVFTGSAPVAGVDTTSPAWTPSPTTSGTFYWVAKYGGDANNTSVASGCADEPFNIQQAPSPGMKVTKLESFSSSSGFVPGPITGQVGQTVYYEMDVFNTGNTPLAIQFSDPGCDQNTLSGPTTLVGSVGADGLSSGGELQWTCSHVLTAADVAGYTNTATAQGTPPPGQGSVQNGQASVVAFSNTPGMQVVKLQRDGSTGTFTTSQITGSVGDTINYEIQVTNTGNVPLTLSISDPHCDGTPAGPFLVSGTLNGNVLAAGGVAQYTCSHVLSAGDIPQFTNVGTITGQPPSGPPLTGTGIVVVNVTQAAIKVLKLQSLSASGPFTPSTLTAKVGQTIYYEIQATNTGNAPLTLAISDPMCDANTLQGPVALTGTITNGALSAGGEAQYTCTHVLTANDNNPFTNTAVVTGTPPVGPPVSGTSSVTANRAAVKKIHIKRCPAGTVKRTVKKNGKTKVVCKVVSHPPKKISGFTGRAHKTGRSHRNRGK